MRCKVCDSMLNDYELTRKDPQSGEYLDTCSDCLKSIRDALADFEDNTYQYDIGLDSDKEDMYNT